MKSSERRITIRTGMPLLPARMAAAASSISEIFPPKPPPISVGTSRTRFCEMPITSATALRSQKVVWVELQMV